MQSTNDFGAGSSYVSAKLIELLHMKPAEIQTTTIDMLLSLKQARLEVYDLELKTVDHQFPPSVKATSGDMSRNARNNKNGKKENIMANLANMAKMTILPESPTWQSTKQ